MEILQVFRVLLELLLANRIKFLIRLNPLRKSPEYILHLLFLLFIDLRLLFLLIVEKIYICASLGQTAFEIATLVSLSYLVLLL